MPLATRTRMAAAGIANGLQFVGAAKATDSSGDITVDLTALTGGIASAPAEGDIVVVAYAMFGSNQNMAMVTSGYTELADLWSDDGLDTNLGVFYKIMGATPDTEAVADGVQFNESVAIAYVWRGVDQSTPIDVSTTTSTGINSGLADPPAITPVTAGAVILAIGGSISVDGGEVGRLTTNGLDHFVEEAVHFGNGEDVMVAFSAFLDWESNEFDPDAFGLSVPDSTSASWAAVTVALRPA